MSIWVDADACPVVVKEILFKAARRTEVRVTLVANQFLAVPPSPYIAFLQVSTGFDEADNEIVRRMQPNDLVVTADIPLANDVINKGGIALSPRGELFTTDNIASRLSMRDLMDTLRSSGIETGGPAPLSQRDRQQFANHLDRYLNQDGGND